MAHKKGLGSSRNGRDSQAKRLGVKVFAGQKVTGGEIIVRQRILPTGGLHSRDTRLQQLIVLSVKAIRDTGQRQVAEYFEQCAVGRGWKSGISRVRPPARPQ